MSKNLNSPKDEIGIFAAIGQLTTIIAPILYILGYKYASSYFDGLGTGWIVSQINLQETIFYSLQITIPILTAVFFTMELLLDGVPYEKIRKVILWSGGVILLATSICALIWNFNYTYTLLKLTAYGFFVLYGAYIAEVFLAFRRGKSENLKSAIGWIIGSTAFLFVNASTLGEFDAMNALESPEKKFPVILQNPNSGRPQTLRLVSRIGEKYLLMDQANNKKVFRLESNLDGYMIQPLDKYQ